MVLERGDARGLDASLPSARRGTRADVEELCARGRARCLRDRHRRIKHPLALWGSRRIDRTVAITLERPRRARPDVERGLLVVLASAEGLRKAVRDVIGVHAPGGGLRPLRERNVLLDCLPERERAAVKRRLRQPG